MFDIPNNQLMLRQAVKLGVTYWDTADCYGGGRSEKGIGRYFTRRPQDRDKVFLVTKSDDFDPDGMTRLLVRSLERMNTTYVDLYFLHGVSRTRQFDDRQRRWAEAAKAAGKIRLFGFSTHSNMEDLMLWAADSGWIDGIMMTYNYRLMQTERMRDAVAACTAAGIGLTAMKTQADSFWRDVGDDSREAQDLVDRFVDRGYTVEQARLKAVWDEPAIASICSQMPNMTILMANAAAAMDRTALSARDRDALQRHAAATNSNYCAGCRRICESRIAGNVPVADILRYLMYYNRPGDRDRARRLFGRLPAGVRRDLPGCDYTAAEAHCPQRIAIGQAMRSAGAVLG